MSSYLVNETSYLAFP